MTGTRPRWKAIYGTDVYPIVKCVSPYRRAGEHFRPEMLEAAVDESAGIGADAHKMVPGYGWVPRWKSERYPFKEHYDWYVRTFGAPDWNRYAEQRGYVEFMLGGGDYVQVFIDRCRRRGLAPLLSVRTDYQGGAGPQDYISRFLYENPQFRLGSSGYTQGVEHFMNWIHPEVREHKLALIAELCAYDIDGLELDLMRRPCYFRLDQTTARERRAVMTGYARQARGLLDRHARPGRRPALVVKIPCHLAEHPLLGIDAEELAGAGVDAFNVSPSYFTQQQTDLAAIREQVPGVPCYLEMADLVDRARPGSKTVRYTTDEQFYTAAHLAFSRGAAGVAFFNFQFYRRADRDEIHEPPFRIFRDIGDRQALARRPQHWFLARGYGGFDPPYEGRSTAMMMRNARCAPCSPLPGRIEAGQTVLFRLDMAPPAGGWKGDGRLRVQGRETLDGRALAARLGGTPLAATPDVSAPYPSPYAGMLGSPGDYRAWVVPAALLRDGVNRFEVTMTAGEPAELFYLDIAMP